MLKRKKKKKKQHQRVEEESRFLSALWFLEAGSLQLRKPGGRSLVKCTYVSSCSSPFCHLCSTRGWALPVSHSPPANSGWQTAQPASTLSATAFWQDQPEQSDSVSLLFTCFIIMLFRKTCLRHLSADDEFISEFCHDVITVILFSPQRQIQYKTLDFL